MKTVKNWLKDIIKNSSRLASLIWQSHQPEFLALFKIYPPNRSFKFEPTLFTRWGLGYRLTRKMLKIYRSRLNLNFQTRFLNIYELEKYHHYQLKLMVKLYFIVYYGWASDRGSYGLNLYFYDQLKIIQRWRLTWWFYYSFKFVDRWLWFWYWLLTDQDLRTEYLKQSVFLHHFTGNLIFMFNLGLPGEMYREWMANPINGRKCPIWFYLRWRWRYHWRLQWLAWFPRWVYWRTVQYRLRDLFLIPQGWSNRFITRLYFDRLIQNRYQSYLKYKLYHYYQVQHSNFHSLMERYINGRLARLKRKGKIQQRFYRKCFKFIQAYREQGNILTFKGRVQRRLARDWLNQIQPREVKLKQWAEKFNQYRFNLRKNNFQLIKVKNYYRFWTPTDHPLIDPVPLTLDPVIDDYDFLSDPAEFEDQQDDSDDQGDDQFNFDFFFGLKREFEDVHDPEWCLPERTLLSRTNKFDTRKLRRKYWYSLDYKLMRRHQRNYGEFITLNLKDQSHLFDDELCLPSGDGPQVVDDDYDLDDHEEYEPRETFTLTDWFQQRSTNQFLTDQKIQPGSINHWFFWYSSQFQRGVDELPRQSLAQIKQFQQSFFSGGKKKYHRLAQYYRYLKVPRKLRRKFLANRQRRTDFRRLRFDRLTRERRFFFYKFGNYRSLNNSQQPTLERLGWSSRWYYRLHPKQYGQFLHRHRQHLTLEGVYHNLRATTLQPGRQHYLWRWLKVNFTSQNQFWLNFKLARLYRYGHFGRNYQNEFKNRESSFKYKFRRVELLLKFFMPSKKEEINRRSPYTLQYRYYNNRPVPRRLQPVKHYPKYNPVYNSNQQLSYYLTGQNQTYFNQRSNFSYTQPLSIGWGLCLGGVLLFDDLWVKHNPQPYQFSWFLDPSNQVYLNRNYKFSPPDWTKLAGYTQFDFTRTEHFSSRDGFQKRIFPDQVYRSDQLLEVRQQSGLAARMRLNHFYPYLVNERTGMWLPHVTHYWLSGKGLRDWVLVTGQVRWMEYYSPIQPLVGDKHYWLSNVQTHSRYDYLMDQPLTDRKWKRIFMVYRKLYNKIQTQRFEYMNSWNTTLYGNYLFHSPRSLYGVNPVKLDQRMEPFLYPLRRNLDYTHHRHFQRLAVHGLGFENYLNFPRRPARFSQPYFMLQLPLWESYLNSVTIQHWRDQSMFTFQQTTLYRDRPYQDLKNHLNQIVNYFQGLTLNIWWGWVYLLRFFLLFGGPYFFLTRYRQLYLYRLSFNFLSPGMKIQPLQRKLTYVKPILVQPQPLKKLKIKRRRSTLISLWPWQRRRTRVLYQRRRRGKFFFRKKKKLKLLAYPTRNRTYRFKKKKLIRSYRYRLPLYQIYRLNLTHRRISASYKTCFQRSNYRPNRQISVITPRNIIGYSKGYRMKQNQWGGKHSLANNLLLHRHIPTLRLKQKLYTTYFDHQLSNKGRKIKTLNFKFKKLTSPQQLLLTTNFNYVKPSSILNYKLSQSIDFRRCYKFQQSRTRKIQQPLIQLPSQKSASYWLARPKLIKIDRANSGYNGYSLVRQPHQNEFDRVEFRQQLDRKRAMSQLYVDDPYRLLKSYFHYERAQHDWLMHHTGYEQTIHYGQNLTHETSPGEDSYNLKYRVLTQDKSRHLSKLLIGYRVGSPSRWVLTQVQHRYHFQRYRQTLTSLPVVAPTPLEPSSIYTSYLRQLAEVNFPGSTINDDNRLFNFEPIIANDHEFNDLEDYVFGGDNSDEDESELTLEEHDSLFSEFEGIHFLGSNLESLIKVQDYHYLSVEHRRRYLLTSYQRYRSLPLTHYQLNIPGEFINDDQGDNRLSEIYFGPYSVDHPGYHQLLLVNYAVPKLYRRLSILNQSQLTHQLRFNKPNFQSRKYRRYYFRWSKFKQTRMAGKTINRYRQHQRRYNLQTNRRKTNKGLTTKVQPDYPLVKPWLTIKLTQQDSIWPDLALVVQDYFFNVGTIQVDSSEADLEWVLQDEVSLTFFDLSLAYNIGYRWGFNRLYSLILWRPTEAQQTSIDPALVFENGLNVERELIPEDLSSTYSEIYDYESCYLEFFCRDYLEGYSFLWYFLEDNSDFYRYCTAHIEDQDEIDEWDDGAEIAQSNLHLPQYLPLYTLSLAVGYADGDSLVERLNNHHRTLILSGYHRIPKYNSRHRYWGVNGQVYRPRQLGRWMNRFDRDYPVEEYRLFYDFAWLAVTYKRRYTMHLMMERGVDFGGLMMVKHDFRQSLLKMWALTDTYYGDIPHGWLINY